MATVAAVQGVTIGRSNRGRIVLPLPSAQDIERQLELLLRSTAFRPLALELPAPKRAEPVCEDGVCSIPEVLPPRVGLGAFCSALDALQHESGKAFASAGGLLLRYVENAATEDDPKYRRIRGSNAAFQKRLAPHPSAPAALEAVGFEATGTESGGAAEAYLLSQPDVELLRGAAAALRRELRRERMRGLWPQPLHCELNTTDAALEGSQDLLDDLTKELSAPHVRAIVDHRDNQQRIIQTLHLGADGVRMLIEQLAEIRQNVTSSAASAGPSRRARADGPSRVVHVSSRREERRDA